MIIKIFSISLYISSKFKHHNGHTVCVGPLSSHCFDIVSNLIDLILFHLICYMLAKFFGVKSESTVSKFRKRKRKRPFFWCAHVLHKAGTWRAREIRKFPVAVVFSNETLCKYCFSMSRDKILFVIKLQKLKKQQDAPNFGSAILHKEMNTSKCGKFILMATGYFLRWRPSYHSFPGPPLSKMAAESNFPPLGRSGCQIPYPRTLQFPWVAPAPSPILGQPLIGA